MLDDCGRRPKFLDRDRIEADRGGADVLKDLFRTARRRERTIPQAGEAAKRARRNAGYFIRNFYQVTVRPHAGERELLLASRLVTILSGVLIILATLWFASLEDMPIFKLMVNFGG